MRQELVAITVHKVLFTISCIVLNIMLYSMNNSSLMRFFHMEFSHMEVLVAVKVNFHIEGDYVNSKAIESNIPII